ncbi:DUF2025 family protein [Pseudomonas sp. KFB-139]|uniref:DUF2025 family protein n=1 Tax=Pseudomonas serbiensis TaxID=3064350 RepID=A0ABT9CPX8_9PSED|nr:DUF2025 family protein [Pseudomonas sp. KFB-138]MDO7927553.1 DUF2025 family protein [Pseudomonas sp. KFB-138]
MSTTSSDICEAAEQLEGFVGYHHKHKHFIVRFSEDSFGMDVTEDSITPTSEFVWSAGSGAQMSLSRERLQLLLDQNIDSRLNITEPLRVYMRRQDLPEIKVERWVKV